MPRRYELSNLCRLETAWHPPWLVAGVTQVGRRHYHEGALTDDAYRIGGIAGAFWLIASDGVGDATLSSTGSDLCVTAVEDYVASCLTAGAEPSRAMMVEAFAKAHEAILEESRKSGFPKEKYSATLAAVVFQGQRIVAAALGDSSIVAYTRHDENDAPVDQLMPFCSAPQTGRPNVTFAIAHSDWRSFTVTAESTTPHIQAIIVSTDGAQSFFTRPVGYSESHFTLTRTTDIVDAVEALSPLLFTNVLDRFLHDVSSRDDRTLLLATRLPERLQPPYSRP